MVLVVSKLLGGKMQQQKMREEEKKCYRLQWAQEKCRGPPCVLIQNMWANAKYVDCAEVRMFDDIFIGQEEGKIISPWSILASYTPQILGIWGKLQNDDVFRQTEIHCHLQKLTQYITENGYIFPVFSLVLLLAMGETEGIVELTRNKWENEVFRNRRYRLKPAIWRICPFGEFSSFQLAYEAKGNKIVPIRCLDDDEWETLTADDVDEWDTLSADEKDFRLDHAYRERERQHDEVEMLEAAGMGPESEDEILQRFINHTLEIRARELGENA